MEVTGGTAVKAGQQYTTAYWVHWRKSDGDEKYAHYARRDAWETVLPELPTKNHLPRKCAV